jgi:hypothetical protein
VKKSDNVWSLPMAGGALGALAALMLAAPAAQADPELPGPPPPPGEQPITVLAAPGVAPAPPEADPALPAPPPAEVPHLLSPENLPPGTSDVPLDPQQGRGTSYLRDLWHAVQTQDISGKDAILLLTQRPLDANAMPTNGLPAGPQAPQPDALSPGAPLPEALPPGAPLPDAAPPDASVPVGPAAGGPPPGPVLPGLAPPAPSP